MQKIFTLFLSAFALFCTMNAEEVTYDFSSSIPNGWTSSVNPNGFEQTSPARGAQFTQSATLTLTGAKGISKVVVTCSANTDKNTLGVTVNGTAFGQTEKLAKEADVEKTFEGTATDGDLVLTLTRSEKSIYIKKVVVTCTEAGNTGGNDDDQLGKDLDPEYVYADIVKVVAPTDVIYKEPCTFVQNNVEVKCTKSTHTDGYFSCLAGERISFTATQPIVAITINGMVKKNFEATVNNGTLYYASSEETEITQDPVIYIGDINEKSVTLTCLKQLQCKEVTLYFKEAPELDLDSLFGGMGGDEIYTYDYESKEVQTLTPAFDELGIVPFQVQMSEEETLPFVNMFFENEEQDKELCLQFIADFDANTVVAPGVYPIDNTLEVGHIVASPGGDEFDDYPSYLLTDYVDMGEYQDWNIFYLVSGTVTVSTDPAGVKVVVDAKSYFGSTIKVTYVGPFIDYTAVDAIDTIAADKDSKNGKYIANGKFYIQKGNLRYNAQGLLVR
jgi:hypothetical protein